MQMMAVGGGAEGALPKMGEGQRLCVFAFDLLVCNGTVLVDEPLITRRAKLRAEFGAERGRFDFVGGEDISSQSGATAAAGAAGAAGVGAASIEEVVLVAEQEDEDGADDDEASKAAAVAGCVAALCRKAVSAGCEGLMVKSLEGPTSRYLQELVATWLPRVLGILVQL